MPERPDFRAAERPRPHGPPGAGSAADQLWWYRDARQDPPAVAPDGRRATGRPRALDALACLAVSTLCFSQASREALLRADWGFYNQVSLGAATLLALILNIVALATGGLLVVQAVRRARRPAWRLVAGVAAVALLISLDAARIAYEAVGRWTDALGSPGLLAIAVAVLAASLGWPRPALWAIRGAAVAASPLAMVVLMLGLWMFLEVAAGPVWRGVDPAPLARSAPSLRRVIWLVFDELDQRRTFEARPPGLELPALDRLRREALSADAARPPAGTTAVSMPALITGRPVVAVTPVSPNDLELDLADGQRARWSAQPSVFTRARALGYDTAVVGWLLPYPRVLGPALGLAAWRPSVAHEQARGATLGQALWNQWGSLVPSAHGRRLHARRAGELHELALRTATDGRFGLVLLHLPVPPGSDDRAADRDATWPFSGGDEGDPGGLAMVDRVIDDLRRGLERARLADRTWMVVSAAHGWGASPRHGGSVDHRVPFLVRPPEGGRARPVDAAFSTLATHELILAILRGSVSDTTDAATWLSRSTGSPPRDYTEDGRPIY